VRQRKLVAIQLVWPLGFVEPCLPTPWRVVPSGPQWVQQIKDDGQHFHLPARWLTDVFGAPTLHEMSKVLLRCMSPKMALSSHDDCL
jgi:hypothetical protein